MIQIRYDSVLVEQVDFLAARQQATLERELHQAIDPLYEIQDEEQRQAAFRRAFHAFFTKMDYHRPLSTLLKERPLITEHVDNCLVREAARKKEESAELYVRESVAQTPPTHRALVIQVCPHSFLDAGALASRMRRELLHVADMLDERFAYNREAISGMSPRQNLLRDRYRVLWDVYVEGRLSREGHTDAAMIERLKGFFGRVFAGFEGQACEEAFERMFQASPLSSQQLLEWAGNAEALLGEAAGSHRSMPQSPGARCPLCGFATHDWFDFDSDADGAVAATIVAYHASWSRDRGACRQCAEMLADPTAVDTRDQAIPR